MAEYKYKKGDVVLLTDVFPSGWNNYMRKFLGAIVTIGDKAENRFNVVEDNYSRIFFETNIVRLATEEDLAKKKEQEKAEKARIKEALKHLVYKIPDVYKIACDVFGEERVDRGMDYIRIYFPEIELTNTPEAKHTIKDLYVLIYIKIGSKDLLESQLQNGGFLANIDLLGERGSMSVREYESGYRHSHLGHGTVGSTTFCLGGSDFSILLQELKMNLTEELWMLMFLSLNNYLSWESLEGGPHIKIENIRYTGRTSLLTLKEELKRIFGGFPKELLEIRETVCLNAHHPSLKEYINRVSTIRSLDRMSQTDVEARIKKYMEKTNTRPVSWKGEKRPFVIYDDDNDKPTIDTPVKAEVLEQYANIIEEEAKKFTKKLNYDRAKQQYKERVFRKVRA